MSHSTRTWWRACSGTRAAHHRCTRVMSSSGRAMWSPTGLVGGGGQGVVGGVELSLAAPVGFVVGVGGQGIDQIVEFGVGQYEVKLVVEGADRENCSLTVVVEERQGSQERSGLGVDDDVAVRLSRGQLLAA